MKRTKYMLLILVLCGLCGLCGCSGSSDRNGTAPTDVPTVSPTAEPSPTPAPVVLDNAMQFSADFTKKHQTIDGFGAGFTWYADYLFRTPGKEKALDMLFKDGGLTILRFKNEYGYSGFENSAKTNFKYYEEAQKRANERNENVTVLYTSWSPEANLKSNHNINGGGTIKKDDDGNYMYDEFAKWWTDSVTAYRDHGIPVDLISIQNECDFQASYDGCEMESTETEKYASYPLAFLATYRLNKELFGDSAPLMIAPETMSVQPNDIKRYTREILQEEPGSIYALAHHLYVGGTSSDNPNSCDADSFMINFMNVDSYAKENNLKKWQTEFYRGTALQTANVINNSLVYENVNAYIFWGGVWNNESPKGEEMYSGNLIIAGNSAQKWPSADGFLATGNYYAMRHFSQFIRPGYVRVDASMPGNMKVRTSAYLSPDGSTLVIVVLNNSDSEVTFQCLPDNFSYTGSQSYQSVFTAGYTADMMYRDCGSLDGNGSMKMPAESVTTIVLTGVQ